MSVYAAGRDLQKGETRRNLRRLLPANRPKLRGCNDFLISNSRVFDSDEAYVYSALFFLLPTFMSETTVARGRAWEAARARAAYALYDVRVICW